VRTLVSFEEARALTLAAARPAPPERVALADALGRTLAAPAVAAGDLPPFTTSAMDGLAVRAADVATAGGAPVVLRVVETVHAGRVPARKIKKGLCARIMTGAPLPDGADAVVPVEWTEDAGEDHVRVLRPVEPGRFVRPRGEALREGASVLAAGAIVTPAAVGMLAALGFDRVEVARAPRLAVVATGDELVDVGVLPGPGQIRDSNGPALAAQARACGADALPPLRARDDEAALRAALDAADAADVLVFAGGVSMGERDLVRDELARRGVRWAFWQVRQRPGKPLCVGVLPDGRPVVGLPGNPVSASVCFEVYVRPLVAAMLGRPERTARRGVLAEGLEKPAGLHVFARVRAAPDAEGRLALTSAGPQGSHVYRTVLDADGLAHLPEALAAAPPGLVVAYEPW